jgi:DNA repair exonuclease SbcCD nuclease subunit
MSIKIMHSADWHILLHKKKVPYSWQVSRFKSFFRKLIAIEQECDVHIIAGDVFDKKPEPDEICLFLSYINSVTIPTFIIPGNHEATKKGETFFEYFTQKYAIKNDNVRIITKNERIETLGTAFQFFPYGEMQIGNIPTYVPGDILVTHIRGEVKPYITAEFDFELLRPWQLILLGDLHFHHRYQDYPAYYSGSPLNVSFDREYDKKYGINIINFNSISDYTVEFKNLNLPKLIRKVISYKDKMVKDEINHVIYEVTGSIDELASVENNELLDKKVTINQKTENTLDLKNKTIIEELDMYLGHIKVSNIQPVLDEYKSLGIT